MKEVILLLTVLVMFIVCFFVMGKIGYFINENYKAFIIEEREKYAIHVKLYLWIKFLMKSC